jgi:glycosyltransferase involved in cell wall biosynthesis
MRLGLDGRILAHAYSGIGCYLICLIDQFKRNKAGEIFLYSDRPVLPLYRRELERVKVVVFGEKHRRYWGRWLLASQLRKDRIDLYHAIWNRGIPFAAPCPTVVTVYDLFPLMFPEMSLNRRRKWKYLYHLFMDGIRADRIITISECTRRDLIERFPLFEKKTAVILLGIDRSEYLNVSQSDVEKWKKHFGLQNPYLISVLGRLDEKRKNTRRLSEGFERFRKDHPEVSLVIIGSGMTAQAENNGFVKILENVPRIALISLMRGAEFMVHPTLYEGFGLPILEAMACGIPVIAAEGSSVSEIFGGAALLVNPNDKDALGAEMKRLMEDPSLRNQFKRLGGQKAEQLSWDKTAEQTLRIYQQLLKQAF